VTSAWWTGVTAEARRITLRLGRDERLLTAVSSAVAFIGEQAGLESAAQADLVAAVEEACRETFPMLPNEDPQLELTVGGLADRVEVTLEHRGAARGLESFLAGRRGPAGGASGLSLLSRVDRVQFSSESGASKTTLIKYLRPLISETT
jgi:hypothetical protein